MEQTPDPKMRISDADRHKIADVLQEAAGEGRIDFDELDDRLEATWAAKCYEDLVPIVADLPGRYDTPGPPGTPVARQPGGVPEPATQPQSHLAIMSEVNRKGSWVVPPQFTAFALMGGVNLDLREATFAQREVSITINAVMGGGTIIVGPEHHVILEGQGIMGSYTLSNRRVSENLTPESPTIRVRGIAVMGGVSVVRKKPRGSSKLLGF